jgi:cytochrome P450
MDQPTELAGSIPSHVPRERVVDYDVYHSETSGGVGDLHAGLYAMAERHGRGIFWTPRNGGHWFINDYELLFEAARRPDLFSSTAMTIPPVPQEPILIPLYLDPPEHGLFRAPLMREFSPGKMLQLKSGIRAFAGELIDAVAPTGRCDFVEAIAEPMPHNLHAADGHAARSLARVPQLDTRHALER